MKFEKSNRLIVALRQDFGATSINSRLMEMECSEIGPTGPFSMAESYDRNLAGLDTNGWHCDYGAEGDGSYFGPG